jgi:hypothetical protein
MSRPRMNPDEVDIEFPLVRAGLGVGAVCHYRRTNPVLAAIGEYAITQVVLDYQQKASAEP